MNAKTQHSEPTAPASPPTGSVLRTESPFELAAFLTPAVVMTPSYVDSAVAAEQVPFLSWLYETTFPRTVLDVGATDATTYFALCQAADAFSRDVRCHLAAIGLEREGPQSRAKIGAWIEHQNSHHGTRSQILGGDIGEVASMAQEQVDLLVIHADATPPDVLQQWKSELFPLLSPHSVVFVDGLGQGPHAFFDDLASQGTAFRFHHGTGFGVVAGGTSPPELLRYLCAQAADNRHADTLRSLFQRLGLGCRHDRDQRESRRQRRRIRAIADELSQAQEELSLAASRLVGREAEIQELRDRLNWNRDQLQQSQAQCAALLEGQSELENANHSLQSDLARSTAAQERLRTELETAANGRRQQERIEAAARAESEVIRSELDRVYASRSWKITAPLRWLAASFRR